MASFDSFWAAYPKRTPYSNPKRAAALAWQRAIKRGVKPADLVRGAEGYAQLVKTKRIEAQFVCMASTFLNGDRYEDFLVDAAPTKNLAKEILLGNSR